MSNKVNWHKEHRTPAEYVAKRLDRCQSYKVYPSLVRYCGDDLAAKSRALVLSYIISRLRDSASDYTPDTINFPEDVEEYNWLPMIDNIVTERLGLSRPTLASALKWLDETGILVVARRRLVQGGRVIRCARLNVTTWENVECMVDGMVG